MKKFFQDNWKFLLFVLLSGLIGGFCTGIYSYDTLSEDMLAVLREQNVTREMLALSSMLQYGILFGVVTAAFGIVISGKVHLWKAFRLEKKAVLTTAIITAVAALCLFPGDKLIFGPLNEWIGSQYTAAPTVCKIVGGLLVGGVIEEVMMRLFFMSLCVLILSGFFCKKEKEIPVQAYIIANVFAATLFAAGHLPTTMTMTALTPVILIRCFLFNGGLGIGFGYLYRKYGIGYAMIAHGFGHLIADTLMMIFI
ncbi:MAG: CPBP family intramembrane metalloprotease [Solobacterium sp.]|nr:CPBP family intramembrane metalloprotease [Solobacterium sp.]